MYTVHVRYSLRAVALLCHAIEKNARAGCQCLALLSLGKATSRPANLPVWANKIRVAHMLVVEADSFALERYILMR